MEMKTGRSAAEGVLERTIARYVNSTKEEQAMMMACYKKYNIPFFRLQTILRMEASSIELRTTEIFWLLDCLGEKYKSAGIDLSTWFTEIEIENYRKMKHEVVEVRFPIVLPLIQVTDTQWIGAIKASTLILWRDNNMRYNKNIQRKLRDVVRGDLTYEVIDVNKKDVEEIVNLLTEGKYIPTPITLNLDDDADFYYDEETGSLIINSLTYFDLVDGYKRMVALSKANERVENFEYNMELRIQNLSEEWANQFINQEQQAKPFPKKTIRSYNMFDVANKITRRVNSNAQCNVAGNITRSGRIDYVDFSEMVDAFFTRGLETEEEQNKALIEVSNDLVSSINAITGADYSLISKKFDKLEIRLLMYACHEYSGKADKSGIYEYYTSLLKREFTDAQKNVLLSSRPTVKAFKRALEG